MGASYIPVRTKTGDKIHLAETSADTTNGNTVCGHEWYEKVRGNQIDESLFCQVCQGK
jgi:hypothetical protein